MFVVRYPSQPNVCSRARLVLTRITGRSGAETMADRYPYIIVGGQVAGAAAVDGIRELDAEGPILLLRREKHLPYDPPPLSKALWLGKKTVEQIYRHDQSYYDQQHVALRLGRQAVGLDPESKTVTDDEGVSYQYDKLLLATGGSPKRLSLPGADLPDLCYYRSLDDYLRVRASVGEGTSALVVGGGFIGSEMAAALHANGVSVTMLFLSPYLVSHVFPEELGQALQADYERRGITVHANDAPVAFEARDRKFATTTRRGNEITSDLVLIGVGIAPETALAETAGLETEDGIVVDEYLQTSHPDIYAAGDNAFFAYPGVARRMRLEHWDNAVGQGRQVGRNMAGADEPFTYMPYFFSDLFDFGYEAVGEVSSQLSVFADWAEPHQTGVLYYLDESKVRGVMMCNVWDKVEAARNLIREGGPVLPEDLRGAIR